MDEFTLAKLKESEKELQNQWAKLSYLALKQTDTIMAIHIQKIVENIANAIVMMDNEIDIWEWALSERKKDEGEPLKS